MSNAIIEKNGEMRALSPCSNCENKFVDAPNCRAFDVIPMEILLGKNKHSSLFPGQETDILFKAR